MPTTTPSPAAPSPAAVPTMSSFLPQLGLRVLAQNADDIVNLPNGADDATFLKLMQMWYNNMVRMLRSLEGILHANPL